MSVFSMIRKGHRAAKEHNAKQAEKERKEQEKPAYKHVPRHAAIDALSGGPASYREMDRQKIVEQNRRRSAMTASGVGMGGMMTPVHAGMPRTNSSLSYVSYPSAYASPVVQVPRAYSYSSMNPGWSHHGGEMSYGPVDPPSAVSSKGKEIERLMTDSGRGSRSSSKGSNHRVPVDFQGSSKDGGASPVGSSSGSTSSQDDLEMRPAKPDVSGSPTRMPVKAPRPASDIPDSFHRLHPSSHSRKNSDPNYYPPQARNPYAHHAPRPGPPSRTNSFGTISAGIPPVPALPHIQLGAALTTQSVVSPTSSTSSVTMVPAASTHSLPAKVSAPAIDNVYEPPGRPLSIDPTIAVGQAVTTPAPVPVSVLAPVSPPRHEHKSRRLSKTTKFTELETIDSNISSLSSTLDFGFSSSRENAYAPPPAAVAPSPTFSEPTPPASPQESVIPQQRKGKLSKTAPRSHPPPAAANVKPKKTARWSLRGSKTAAVAG